MSVKPSNLSWLRARARDMFTGVRKDEKAAHVAGTTVLPADDLAALENENERAFVDLLTPLPQHIADVAGGAMSTEFPNGCAKTALDLALKEMDDRKLGGKREMQREFDDTDLEGKINPRAYVKRMKALKSGLDAQGIVRRDDDILTNLLVVMEKDEDMRTLGALLEDRRRNAPNQRLNLTETVEHLYEHYRKVKRDQLRMGGKKKKKGGQRKKKESLYNSDSLSSVGKESEEERGFVTRSERRRLEPEWRKQDRMEEADRGYAAFPQQQQQYQKPVQQQKPFYPRQGQFK